MNENMKEIYRVFQVKINTLQQIQDRIDAEKSKIYANKDHGFLYGEGLARLDGYREAIVIAKGFLKNTLIDLKNTVASMNPTDKILGKNKRASLKRKDHSVLQTASNEPV